MKGLRLNTLSLAFSHNNGQTPMTEHNLIGLSDLHVDLRITAFCFSITCAIEFNIIFFSLYSLRGNVERGTAFHVSGVQRTLLTDQGFKYLLSQTKIYDIQIKYPFLLIHSPKIFLFS